MAATFHDHAFHTTTGPLTEFAVRTIIATTMHGQRLAMRNLATRYLAGDLTPAQFERAARNAVKDAYLTQYVIGRGGRTHMTATDWGRIGGLVGHQYTYLERLFQANDDLSVAQLGARLELYINSSTQGYYRGRAADFQITLPAYPGDGNSECRANCRCHWSLHDDPGGVVLAYWQLSPVENCRTCAGRAIAWNPFIALKKVN